MSGTLAVLGAIGGAFNPKSISGLTLWFDGSDASTITIATGISTWKDKSGNANDATQGSGSSQPTVHTSAQNGLNSVKAVSASSQDFNLTTPISLTSGYTAFLVGKRATTGSVLVALGATVTTQVYVPVWYLDSAVYTGGTVGRAISSAQSVATFNLICTGQNASENAGFVRFNRTDITSNASDTGNPSAMTSINWIFATASIGHSDGEIGEYLVYSPALSLAPIQQVENYLRAKWATP